MIFSPWKRDLEFSGSFVANFSSGATLPIMLGEVPGKPLRVSWVMHPT